MHGYGLFLYSKRNNLFKEFELKIKTKSLDEIIEEETLIKLDRIYYKIKEESNSTSDEKYNFESYIIDNHENEYKNLEIIDHMKIIEDFCIFYSTKKLGFYMENNDLLKKILMIIFDKTKLTKNEILYTKQLIDNNFNNIIHRK